MAGRDVSLNINIKEDEVDKAKGVMAGFNTICRSKTIEYATKAEILKTFVFSRALIVCR
jgi:hypothetical protein